MSESRTDKITKHFRENITIEDGVIKAPDDLFDGIMPSGITRETIEKVQNFEKEIAMPLTLTVSERVHAEMLENKKIENIATSFKLGSDNINISINRKGTEVDENGKAVDVYGQVIYSTTKDLGKYQAEFDECIGVIHEEYTKSFGGEK